MGKAGPDLLVIDKVYDLAVWSARHVAKFPRSHKFTLGDRLTVRLYEVLELLLRAKYRRDRRAFLRDANMELELLRFQFRLAKDLECLSVESYGYAARAVDEIGRLIGGWIKTADREATRAPVGPGDELSQSSAGGPEGTPGQG
jgi:hypothetical protein